MIPSEYMELMHGEIDGVNDANQSRRLREYLAGHPAADDHYRELRGVTAVLDDIEMIDPPGNLRRRILDAADAIADPSPAAAVIPTAAAPGGLRSFWWDLRRLPGHRLAFTTGFALGLLLLVVVWQSVSPVDPVATDDLRGAILRQVESGRGTRSESVSVDLDGATLTVQSYEARPRTLIRFVVAGDRPVTVKLILAGPIACEGYLATPPTRGELVVTDREITLTFPGAGEFDLFLNHPERDRPQIDLQVIEGRTIRFETPIARRRN